MKAKILNMIKLIGRKIAKKLGSFSGILEVILYVLGLLSIISIITVFFDACTHLNFTSPNKNSIILFLIQFESFKGLFSATIAVLVAYIGLKNYNYNKEKDCISETYKAVESYLSSVNANFDVIYEKFKEKELIHFSNENVSIESFVAESLNNKIIFELIELFKVPETRKAFNAIINAHEILSVKYLNGYIKKDIILKFIGKEFVNYVQHLRPGIALLRTNKKGHPNFYTYQNTISMYSEIYKELNSFNKEEKN
jgi:hypothetical protein